MRPCKYRKGDWVRFYKDNKLVIGVVEYIREPIVGTEHELMTDNGTVIESCVIEYRPENHGAEGAIPYGHLYPLPGLPYHVICDGEEVLCETPEDLKIHLESIAKRIGKEVQTKSVYEVGNRGTTVLVFSGRKS